MLSAGMSLIGALDAEGYWALGGIGRQLIDSLIEKGYATPPTGSVAGAIAQDPEMLKLYLLRMARDAGVEILFHSFVVDVDAGDRQIRTVTVANKGGLTKYSARVFIDCSGDADVIANSGGECKFGREGDNATQPVSNLFRVANGELDKCFEYETESGRDQPANRLVRQRRYAGLYPHNTGRTFLDIQKTDYRYTRKGGPA
jgi:flavin-dependent dehydrogenase